MLEEYPVDIPTFDKEEEDVETIIEFISLVRTLRGEYNISPALRLNVFVKSEDKLKYDLIKDKEGIISLLAKTASILSTNEDMKIQLLMYQGILLYFCPLKELWISKLKGFIRRYQSAGRAAPAGLSKRTA